MSLLDGVMNAFKMHGDDYDDEYDDYDDEYEDEDDVPVRKKLFTGSKKNADEEESDQDSGKVATRKIAPVKTTGKRGLEVVVIRPESMDDSTDIIDTLLIGKAVVLNLEGIHVEIAQRIIDFSGGACYAMGGNLQKITNYIFLVTPHNVEISGDIPELMVGGINLSSFANTEKKF